VLFRRGETATVASGAVPSWNIRLAGVFAASGADDSQRMLITTPPALRPDAAGEVEFFGVKLKVSSPRLAALLNSDVTDEVTVVVRRVRGTLATDDADSAGESQCETIDVRLEQAIASTDPADVQLRPAGVQPADGDDGYLVALVEHPA